MKGEDLKNNKKDTCGEKARHTQYWNSWNPQRKNDNRTNMQK